MHKNTFVMYLYHQVTSRSYMQTLTVQQIGYWEVYDGSAIRELDASLSGAINGIDISEDGKYFVTGIYLLFHILFYYGSDSTNAMK